MTTLSVLDVLCWLIAVVIALPMTIPDVVIIVDADCTLEEGFVDRLASAAAAGGRPVQSCNLVIPPAGAGLKDRLSWFAFQYKNLVRPLGLDRLGLPCLLSTGAAFPWPVIRE